MCSSTVTQPLLARACDDSTSHYGFIRFSRKITILNICKTAKTPCCSLTTERTLSRVNIQAVYLKW